MVYRDFPGHPVVKTPRFYCRGLRLDPRSGNKDATWLPHSQKKKKRERERLVFKPRFIHF